MSDTALDTLLLTLARSRVRFVVIGGIAVGVHGYVRGTKDIDVCPEPSAENLRELAALLRDLARQQVVQDVQHAGGRPRCVRGDS